MGQRHQRGVTRESADEQAMRDQEVLRANRELSAYFRGRRTEREARAALKIIKAFVRDRERLDPKSRPALPGLGTAKMPKNLTNQEATSDSGERRRRRPRRKAHERLSKKLAVSSERQMNSQPPVSPEPDERTP